MRKRALKDNRIDDASDKIIDQRIATYEAETKPILDFYPDDRITTIDATQPPVKVLAEMIHCITQLPVYHQMAQGIA
jgi:adenylate kinase